MTVTGRATIYHVARAAGVSPSTVSKVLNGRPGISAPTTARVLAVVEELGFETSLVASGLRSRRTHVVGVLSGRFEPFSAEVFKGVAAALARTDYALLAYTGDRRGGGPGWERRLLARLSGTLVDGAVLVTPTAAVDGTGFPVVAIDPHAGPDAQPSVDSDGRTGARLATEHLLGLGHRRIAFVSGSPGSSGWSRRREQGFREAMTGAGVRVDEALVVADGPRPGDAVAAVRGLLTRADRPTAVVAAYDVSALAVVDAARSLGLAVPDDVSVVGFGDIPEAAQAEPPLTTVSQSIQEMGAAAVRLLTGLIDGVAACGPHVRLPTRLVVRRSTARPPGHGHHERSPAS